MTTNTNENDTKRPERDGKDVGFSPTTPNAGATLATRPTKLLRSYFSFNHLRGAARACRSGVRLAHTLANCPGRSNPPPEKKHHVQVHSPDVNTFYLCRKVVLSPVLHVLEYKMQRLPAERQTVMFPP